MKTSANRILSLLLCLVMLVSTLAGLTTASAAGSTINTGTRHELCTSLSSQAVAYYTGSNTWESLSALSGISTTSSVDAMGSPLFNALQKLMKGTLTTTVSYKSLTTYWKDTDRQKGGSDAILFYSDVQGSGYNREHVWPKSHGNFYESGAGSDLQHLRPADSVINSTRNHWTFGDVKARGISHSTKDYNGKTVLWYNSSYSQNDCLGLVEVNDNIKGDIARILLYVYTTYGVGKENSNLFTKTASSGSGNSANTGDKVIESLDTLLEWMEIDPVDTWEMSRNDCVENIQGNRNAFIDYPEFAWLLFGRDVPADYDTPSGNGGQATTYTITPVANGNGTVSLSGNVITAIPANGYYVASYEVTKGTATVTQNGNSFSVKPTTDCTVQINFAAKTAVTVSFSVPSGVSQNAINCYAGDSITLPTPSGTPTASDNEYQFIGWAAQSLENVTEKPVIYAAGSSFTPNANTTFYALYRYYIGGQGTGDGYTKITSETELTDGASYVFVSTVSGKAMSTDVGSNWINLGGSYTGDTIETPAASDIWTLVDGVLTCEEGNLYSAAAKSVTLDSEEGTEWTFTLTGSQWQLSYGNNILCCNGTSGWRPYSGGYGSDRSFYIYKEGSAGTTYYTTVLGEACDHSNTKTEHKDATCTESGYDRTVCKDCGAVVSETVIKALGHNYSTAVIAPTCTAQGYTTHTCTRCADSYKDTYTNALGHSWDAGVVTKPATATDSGIKTYTCTRCSATKTEIIPATGDTSCKHQNTHSDHKDATCTESGYDRTVCNDCGEVISEAVIKALGHNYSTAVTAPTCTAQGYTAHTCSRCGDSYKDTYTNALGHSWNAGVVTKQASCTEKGVLTYTCTRCAATKTDEIAALGHNYSTTVIAPTCTEKGYALHTCSRCGNSYKDSYTAALGHDFGEWTVMTEATCTKDGKESRTCARCNFVETQAIAALGHEYLNGVCIYCGEKDPNYKPDPIHCNGGKNCPSRLFSDLDPKQWYHEGIDYAIENDLMNGVDTRLFDPNGSLTRAMLVTILYRMENEPHVNWKENPFDDVPYGAWYTNAVIWAAREGIVNGVSETEFAPDEFITREQIAAILYRYAGSPRVHGNLRFFADNDSISEYAYDAMVWAVDKEIITGSDYLLLPKDDATRAQIANILYRYIVN